MRTGGEACWNCGYLPQRTGRPFSVGDGELGLVQGGRARSNEYDPAERRQWMAMLKSIGAERGYKPGWVAHKYKEKFGGYPPWDWSTRSRRSCRRPRSAPGCALE